MALLHRRSTSKRASQKMRENNAVMPDDTSANDNVSSARPSPQHSFQLHLTKSSISAISWPSADACSAICGRCASSPLCC